MESHRVIVGDGVRLHYVCAGASDAPALLLLHGFPTDWRLYRNCIEPLTQKFRVYALDLPGHGESDRRADLPYDLDFYGRTVISFLDALDLPRVHLAVHDLGGMVGLYIAGKHPGRVDRFVVMDTAPYGNWSRLMKFALSLLRSRLVSRLMTTRLGFALTLWLFTTRNRDALRRLVRVFHSMWRDTPERRTAYRLVSSLPPERLTPEVSDLRRIESPTLILWAEQDPIFPVRVAEKLQRDIPQAVVRTVPGSGHFLPEERPEVVAQSIMEFLSQPS